jgi:hypothetical protein
MSEHVGGQQMAETSWDVNFSDEEFKDVLTEETTRGRKRPVLDASIRRKREELLNDLRKLIESGDKELFLEAIRVRGLQDGSEAFEFAVEIWRQIQRGK